MEGNRGGRMPPASISSGMLGLDMSSIPHHNARQQQQQQQLFPLTAQNHEAFGTYPTQGVNRQHSPLSLGSDQDHAEPCAFGDDAVTAKQRFPQSPSSAPSPWQRMKWTDNMVRLLIMIVYCIGDDAGTIGGNESIDFQPATTKGKKTQAAAATSSTVTLMQKKGKWKSVSRAMMEKGFYVSPQQCEDKFNDLNKRYKRVNELLGKGTACRVVENQALLDSMDHLSLKAKEEARKLLNSKHLFFREMCAYHNSGGTTCDGGGGNATVLTSNATLPQQGLPVVRQSHQAAQQHQPCLHHTSGEEGLFADKASGNYNSSSRRAQATAEKLDEEKDDEDANDDEDEDGDGDGSDDDVDDDDGMNDDYDDEDHNKNIRHHQENKKETSKQIMTKRTASTLLSTSSMSASPPLSLSLQPSSPMSSASMEQFKSDLMGSLSSVGGEQEQRLWLKRKAVELEEQRIGYQYRALELDRQRYKWLRFSSNKEWEMEKMKLSNERQCLENDRMLLLLRQKEQELMNSAAATADHVHHIPLH